jgi:hypothetical protein
MNIKSFSPRLAAAPVLEDTPQNRQMVITRFAKKFMPSGTRFDHHGAHWLKRGGHAGANALRNCEKRAEALGFVEQTQSNDSSPDGSRTSDGTTYKHPVGWVLVVTAIHMGPLLLPTLSSVS